MVQARVSATLVRSLTARLKELPFVGTLRNLLKVRLAGFGLFVILAFVVIAVFANLIAPYDPLVQNYHELRQAPSFSHWLGTDDLGRDIMSRLMYGARTSLIVGVLSAGVAIVLGVPIGLAAGYFRGWVDEGVMRVMDALYSFPAILLALAIVAVLGPGMVNVMIAIGLTQLPIVARLMRGQVVSAVEQDYVLAAKAVGASDMRTMAIHIFPNTLQPVLVQSTLIMAFAVLTEASLSFLGIGITPPKPTWGIMLKDAYPLMNIMPWYVLSPGVVIVLLVLSLNLVGDALRDVLDPRLGRALGLR